MRDLFSMDAKNYPPDGRKFVRPSARGIVIRGKRIELVYVSSMGYYKFPGGGIDPGETPEEALIREAKEEAGLIGLPETVKEYGRVHRIEFHSEHGDVFDQENFYYFCETAEETVEPELTETERAKGFQHVLEDPSKAAAANRAAAEQMRAQTRGYDEAYAVSKEIEREGRVLELLLEEGYFGSADEGIWLDC